jgi:uncharacterized protein
LLQCLVLEGGHLPNQVDLARVLVDAGAEINGPLCAAASIGNVEGAAALLDAGAEINGTGNWSPLEEALYWRNDEVAGLLLARGASVHNLRIAAGLGRVEAIDSFFDTDGKVKPEAGRIDWPFGDPLTSNLAKPIQDELQTKIDQWSDDSRDVINNAFVYACMHNRVEAAKLLLEKGADINAIPPGFDYAGTALHYAALHGHQTMVHFLLEHGADPNMRDAKVNSSPAGWATHGGHQALSKYLENTTKSA